MMKKRWVSVLLTVILFIGSAFCTPAGSAAQLLYGDVNGDGEIEIADVTLIQRHLVGMITLDAQEQQRGAVNGDDKLSATDAALIQRYLIRLIDAFPAEDTTPQEEATKVGDTVVIRFTDKRKWGAVNAYLFDKSSSDAPAKWPGTAMTACGFDGDANPVYSIEVNVSRCDRVIFNNGDTKQTTEAPVTKASYGYYAGGRNGKKYVACIEPCPQPGRGTVQTVYMDYPGYPEGVQKKICIWLPEGYDASDTGKKYPVIYMCDGENLFNQDPALAGRNWQCDDAVRAMMHNGGDGAIIVGVDNFADLRYTELTPDLGRINPAFLDSEGLSDAFNDVPREGKIFSDFVVNDLIPYVESRYRVNSVRGVAGSSSGGIEAFYIGVEHPDKFRFIGALSPAFDYFAKEEWETYLSKKFFFGRVPRIYFYCGSGDETDRASYPYAVAMEGWMKEHGYPPEKMRTVTDEDARHQEAFWALYFPEALCWGLNL